MRAKSGNSSVPAYQKIQVAIRKRIESGDLRPGDVVSSERELARIHQVSLMTARHALDSLQREGVVECRRGVGTFPNCTSHADHRRFEELGIQTMRRVESSVSLEIRKKMTPVVNRR